MRVVCISDSHNMHKDLTMPDGDVLVHAGDMAMHGSLSELEAASIWLAVQPHKHKVVIAGNHDGWLLDVDNLQPIGFSDPSVHYLRDSSVTIDGLKFYGTPWIQGTPGWAFDLTDSPHELRVVRDAIPKSTDVLVTHCPAFGVLDVCPDWTTGRPVHVGCRLLMEAVDRVRPRLHVHGHIHEGYGMMRDAGVQTVNASTSTRQYRPTNRPIVLDI